MKESRAFPAQGPGSGQAATGKREAGTRPLGVSWGPRGESCWCLKQGGRGGLEQLCGYGCTCPFHASIIPVQETPFGPRGLEVDASPGPSRAFESQPRTVPAPGDETPSPRR